jgi:hypothetical protein
LDGVSSGASIGLDNKSSILGCAGSLGHLPAKCIFARETTDVASDLETAPGGCEAKTLEKAARLNG